MSITAQDLDRRITLQRATTVPNELNEPVETWADLATVWAKREDASSGEKEAAGQTGSFLMARFTVRRSATSDGLKPTDRISHEGAIWSIVEKMEHIDAPRRFLTIKAVRDAD